MPQESGRQKRCRTHCRGLEDGRRALQGDFPAPHAHGFSHRSLEQLRLATEAVFRSWNGKRAVDYRNAAKIAHDLGTAVNIQTMVFGNMGNDSATGVAMTRNATTGEKKIEGDYLINAQGEDVVAGIRTTEPVENMAQTMPASWEQFVQITQELENTTATCRISSSRWSAARCTCCRPAMASAPPRPPCASPWK